MGFLLCNVESFHVAFELFVMCRFQYLRHVGLVAPKPVGCSFPDRESNPRPLHHKAHS